MSWQPDYSSSQRSGQHKPQNVRTGLGPLVQIRSPLAEIPAVLREGRIRSQHSWKSVGTPKLLHTDPDLGLELRLGFGIWDLGVSQLCQEQTQLRGGGVALGRLGRSLQEHTPLFPGFGLERGRDPREQGQEERERPQIVPG